MKTRGEGNCRTMVIYADQSESMEIWKAARLPLGPH